MKLGLLTASLGDMPVETVVARAGAMGLDALELAAWPQPLERPFTASHIDTEGSAEASTERLRALLDAHGVELAALAYYDNPLDPDPGRRARVHAHLDVVIDLAGDLDCPLVGTFIGRDPRRTVAENLEAAEQLFPRFVERAAGRGVRLMIENCPMLGWHPDGYPGNLAYSPELWEWLGELGLWLNYDPSHLPPLGIDPIEALNAYRDHVVHVHAKDVVVDTADRNRFSCYGRVLGRDDPWNTGWWSYRLPGEGEVDWAALLATLNAGGFHGTIAIEHEDEAGLGTPERTLAGVVRAAGFLDELLDGRRGVGVIDERKTRASKPHTP